MQKVSIFKNFVNFVGDFPIEEVIEAIRVGEVKDEVQLIRQLKAQNQNEEAGKLKKSLPAFTPSGTFPLGRRKGLIQEYSNHVVVDIDDVEKEKLGKMKARATEIPYTRCCFTSPGGDGLKIIVMVSSPGEEHNRAFNEVSAWYAKVLDVPVDNSGKDICRLCFLSWDPDLYSNHRCIPFPVSPASDQIVMPMPSVPPPISSNNEAAFLEAQDKANQVSTFTPGNKNNFVYVLSCNCSELGIPVQYTIDRILQEYEFRHTDHVEPTVRRAYNYNADKFGSVIINHGATRPDPGEPCPVPFESESAPLHAELSSAVVQEEFQTGLFETPVIPAEIYSNLPLLLRKACAVFKTDREKDLFLTGALSVLSGCMDRVSGTYDQRTVYPNLFSFAIAPVASGKSALFFAKELAMNYHRKIVQQSKEKQQLYQMELDEYKASQNKSKKDSLSVPLPPPTDPGFQLVFLPANCSSAALQDHLSKSGGKGIICETEADTMANSFKQDWGGYSDILRKGFHHEPLSYSRKTNHEYIEIEKPRISVALTGTPSQVTGLISSAEDGLFSRFIFYLFKVTPEWRDVSPENTVNLNEYFTELSSEVDKMIEWLDRYETKFHMTKKQWGRINTHYSKLLNETYTFVSEEAAGTVKRLALIAFRIAMVLSAIRKWENELQSEEITCSELDFNVAFDLAKVYLQHALLMLKYLPKSEKILINAKKRMFFDALPIDREFSTQEAVEIAANLKLSRRTVNNYLKSLRDNYLKSNKWGFYFKDNSIAQLPSLPKPRQSKAA